MEDASTLLWKEGNVFHIIIIEQCLLGVNEFELLRIGREMDLPVIVIGKYIVCVFFLDMYVIFCFINNFVNLTSQYL